MTKGSLTGWRGYAAVAGVAVLLGLALFLWLHDAPVLLQFQGVQMVRAAHSLTEGRGLETAADRPFARWGPLYATLLSALERTGMEVIPAAYSINCLTLAASFLGLYSLCRAMSVLPAWPVLVVYGLWASNYYLLRAVRPDAIPICLSLFVVVALARYSRDGSFRVLLAAAVCCSIAALSRFMVLFTLLPVAAAAVVFLAPRGWGRRLRDVSWFLVVAGAPIGAWLIRNQRLTSYLSGMSRTAPREWAEEHTLVENVVLVAKTAALDTVSFLFMGVRQLDPDVGRPDAAAVYAIGSIVVALLALIVWASRRALIDVPGKAVRMRSPADVAVGLSSTYVLVYLVALLLAWTFGNSDPINTRYVSPVYPFLMALGLWLYRKAGDLPGATRIRFAWWLVALLVLAPNAYKSVRLLGDDPGVRLIEVRHHRTKADTWRHEIEWARPAARETDVSRRRSTDRE